MHLSMAVCCGCPLFFRFPILLQSVLLPDSHHPCRQKTPRHRRVGLAVQQDSRRLVDAGARAVPAAVEWVGYRRANHVVKVHVRYLEIYKNIWLIAEKASLYRNVLLYIFVISCHPTFLTNTFLLTIWLSNR